MRNAVVRGFYQESRHRQFRRRCWLLLAGLWVGFLVVALRLVQLQIIDGPELAHRAEHQHFKLVEVKAERGRILDRKGRILAMDLQAPSVYALPPRISDARRTAGHLAPVLGLGVKALSANLRKDREFRWVARQVSPDVAEAVRGLKLKGIGFVPESRRFYPKGALLGQLIGFTGIDHEGIEGIELRHDGVLRGEKGKIRFERDASGREVHPSGFDYVAPSRGSDLVLTIDEFIQHLSERELDGVLERTGAKAASALVMDPGTGEILAWAVRPSFNPNAMLGRRPGEGRISPEQWRNRIITDIYEPGSTFKLVLASAALQEGVVTPAERIDCAGGSVRVAGSRIQDVHEHGELTFQDVIARSSNVGTVKVAMRLGEQAFYRHIRGFGFGESTGIGLGGEASGLVRAVPQWSRRSLATIAIGQEVGVTSLQMLTAVSAIANGGLLMRPYVVSEVRDAEGRTVRKFSPEVRRRVIAPEVAEVLREMLIAVTEPGGTGENAAIPGYAVAGKTGTAQKFDPSTGHYFRNRFTSSFVGFVPALEPRLAVLVVVEEPQGVAWGGSVAAPAFKAIARDALGYLGIPSKDRDRVLVAEARRP